MEAVSVDTISALNELVALEELNASGRLSPEDRDRLQYLCRRFFGVRMDERRKHLRIRTNQDVRVDSGSDALAGRVTSLGAGGLFIATEDVDESLLNQKVEVKLGIPTRGVTKVPFEVEVCWISKPGQGPETGMGVRFVELDDGQRRVIIDQVRGHLERILELSREKYHFFFQYSVDIAMLLDTEGMIKEINEAGAEMLGVDAESLVGESVEKLVATTELDELRRALEQCNHGERLRLALHLGSPGAEAIPVDATLQSFTVEDLQVGAVLIAHDLRERVQIEAQQRQMERRLFQADKLATIGQITAGIAHDINNPLSYLLSNLAMLEKLSEPLKLLVSYVRDGNIRVEGVNEQELDLLATDLDGLVQDSLEGTRRVRDILHELRAFSRVESREESQVAVNDALDAAIRVTRNVIKHRARLERTYADIPDTYCNFGRLSQVFLNLVTNAANCFEQADLSRNFIQLETSAVDGHIRIVVSDNGPGIAPEQKDRIFDLFFTTRRDQGGTGLGLAIAKENVEALGGTIRCESELGAGTRFIVELPIRKSKHLASVSIVTPEGVQKDRPRVLIIDDEERVARSFGRLLSDRYEIIQETSPVEALALLATEDFDVVLCDVMMPEMSGFDLLDTLREGRPELAARVVFMTGGTFARTEHERLKAASVRVLEKPIEGDVLMRTIAEIAGDMGD